MKKEVYYGPIGLLLIWFLISQLGLIRELFLASPISVIISTWDLIKTGSIFIDIFWTMTRLIIGFSFGVVFGVIIGLPIGYFKKLYSSVELIIDFFRSVPVASLFPLFLILFGIGDNAKIATTMWSSMLIVIVNTTFGVRQVNETRILLAKTLGATKIQTFTKIIFPDSLPHIVAGIRTSLSIAIIVVVMTEMFMGTNYGLGKRIFNASLVYDTPELYACIIMTGLIGYTLNKVVWKIDLKFIHW
jgi:ABC-type nitrate/sulfonate/bicarbonate transport system permease component